MATETKALHTSHVHEACTFLGDTFNTAVIKVHLIHLY